MLLLCNQVLKLEHEKVLWSFGDTDLYLFFNRSASFSPYSLLKMFYFTLFYWSHVMSYLDFMVSVMVFCALPLYLWNTALLLLHPSG